MRIRTAALLTFSFSACSDEDFNSLDAGPSPSDLAALDGGLLDGSLGSGPDMSPHEPDMGPPGPERFVKFQLVNERAAFGLTSQGRIIGFGEDVDRFLDSVEIPADHPARDVRLVDFQVGSSAACGRAEDGRVLCWGPFTEDPLVIASPVEAYSVGSATVCFIRERPGAIECVGFPGSAFGQLSPPSGTFVDVYLDFLVGCGIRTSGRLACWGPDRPLIQEVLDLVPSEEEVSYVEANNEVGCAVKTADDRLACWGRGAAFAAFAPAEAVEDVRLGGIVGCAKLRNADEWRCWDTRTEDTPFESEVPTGHLSGLSLDDSNQGGTACAVRSGTGEAVCWGAPQLLPPDL